MLRTNLDPIFAPRSIAVIGANDRMESVGGSVFANLMRTQFAGPLYPINFRHSIVQGQLAYSSIGDLPVVPDLVVICTSADTIPDLARECGSAGVRGLVIVSAGFRESGAAGRILESKLKQGLQEFPLMRMIGPNCLGVLRPSHRLNASFSPVLPASGNVTLLSQSGALATAIMDWAGDRGIGFAACVSVGNMVNVGIGELIDYFADDDQTETLLLYLEGLDETEHFLAAARACSLKKPVIAYKAGRFEASSKAVASHTGALASADAVYQAAFRRVGIERVHSIEELFDCARLLAGKRHAIGNRLAIVTNAGGPGIMASDAWLELNGVLAPLGEQTRSALDQALPSCWSHGNPIDVLGDATVDRFRTAVRLALADPQVDVVMVIVTPQTMTDAVGIAETVAEAQQESAKTIVASWIGGPTVQGGRDVLRNRGIPIYEFPEAAACALHHLVSAGQRLNSNAGPAPQIWPVDRQLPSGSRADLWRQRLQSSPGLIDEVTSKQLLADFGIPIVPTHVAHSVDEACRLATEAGYPVALKVVSPDISHKTDVGGVMLNLADAGQVRKAYDTIHDTVRQRAPTARWEGVSVQPMITVARGVELLLGMKRDPLFGPVILLGAGGITAELQKDSALELTPLDDVAWQRMLRSLRLYPVLEGYRGRPGINLDRLRETVACFVQLVCSLPELSTAEINPLLATSDRVVALDARLIAAENL